MINDYDVDPDGFDAEKGDNKQRIIALELSYEQLIDFAAQMMTERDYAEGLYYIECDDSYRLRDEVHDRVTKEQHKGQMNVAFRLGKQHQITSAAKHAVNSREDQQLKPGWMEHVKCCIKRGLVISNIGDLLNESGYDPLLANVTPATLKKWAKEAVPSLEFKPGRPK